MSHPERLKKLPKLGVQGAKPLAGVAGCPRKTRFPSFAAACGGARGKKRSGRGDPCNPAKGLAAPLNPAEHVVRARRQFGMTHTPQCVTEYYPGHFYTFSQVVEEFIMDEQPIQEGVAQVSRVKRLKEKLAAFSVVIRLLLAFACGWLFAFIVASNHVESGACFLPLAFPLVLGIVAAFTVDSRSKHLIALAAGTGLLVVVGIYAYLLPITSSEDAREIANCAHRYCHVAGIGTFVLNIILVYSIVLVLIGSVATGLIIKALRRGLINRAS